MACTGHVNECPSHAGYIGPETPTSWTDDPLNGAVRIKTDHWNELRNAIDAETTRRSESWTTSEPDTVDEGELVTDEYKNLRNQVEYLGATVDIDDPNLDKGHQIKSSETTELRDAVNELEEQCVCDCNYACTCNCNYCTCDCNYCTCNCNYACTCNCNYAGK